MSPQSQHPPPPDCPILYLWCLWGDTLKHSTQSTHVLSIPEKKTFLEKKVVIHFQNELYNENQRLQRLLFTNTRNAAILYILSYNKKEKINISSCGKQTHTFSTKLFKTFFSSTVIRILHFTCKTAELNAAL